MAAGEADEAGGLPPEGGENEAGCRFVPGKSCGALSSDAQMQNFSLHAGVSPFFFRAAVI